MGSAQPVQFRRCGVPGCNDGRVVYDNGIECVVECDTHEARTTWDSVHKEPREQQIIRVQDSWRQHGTASRDKR